MSKPQVHCSIVVIDLQVLLFSGLSLAIKGRTIPRDCLNKVSINNFRSCINEIDRPFIKTINAKPYNQLQHIGFYDFNQVILPSDGSFQTRRRNETSASTPTLVLDQTFDYNMFLFDRDSFFHFSNPEIMLRSFYKIHSNISIVIIYVKVNN